MRHHNKIRTLGRDRDQRVALIRGLALSLIEHGQIKTTEGKAKELRPFIERLITDGKSNSISARRLVSSILGNPNQAMVQKLFTDIAQKYVDRNGGYTRIIKLGETTAGRREAIIEFV